MLQDDFYGQALDRVGRGEVDLAVVPFEPVGEILVFEPLLRDVFKLAVPSGHRLAKRKTATLPEVASERIVSMPPESAAWATFRRAFVKAGADYSPSFQTRDYLTMFALIKEGVGVGLVTEITSSVIDMRGIEMLAVRDADLVRTIGIVNARDRTLTSAAETFCKLLRKHADRHALSVSVPSVSCRINAVSAP